MSRFTRILHRLLSVSLKCARGHVLRPTSVVLVLLALSLCQSPAVDHNHRPALRLGAIHGIKISWMRSMRVLLVLRLKSRLVVSASQLLVLWQLVQMPVLNQVQVDFASHLVERKLHDLWLLLLLGILQIMVIDRFRCLRWALRTLLVRPIQFTSLLLRLRMRECRRTCSIRLRIARGE